MSDTHQCRDHDRRSQLRLHQPQATPQPLQMRCEHDPGSGYWHAELGVPSFELEVLLRVVTTNDERHLVRSTEVTHRVKHLKFPATQLGVSRYMSKVCPKRLASSPPSAPRISTITFRPASGSGGMSNSRTCGASASVLVGPQAPLVQMLLGRDHRRPGEFTGSSDVVK